jgi:hypothetical protein
MSLLRTGIVICAAVALLPTDQGQQQQLYAKAMASAGELMTYCDRNPDTCARGAELWERFKVKAAFAAELAMDTLQRYAVPPVTPETSKMPAAQRGTLTDADIGPPWRGGTRRSGA